jgi:hypothetical protein
MHNWNTLGAWMSHEHTQIHKTCHNSNLGEATTFPLIIFSMIGQKATPKCHFSQDPQVKSPKILKIGTPAILEAHNFLCRPSIKLMSKKNCSLH